MGASRRAVSLLLLLACLAQPGARAEAQGGWAPIERVYESERVERPSIAGDATGALHAVWWGLAADQAADGKTVVLYSRWDGTGWTTPNDVLFSPSGNAQLPEALVDRAGRLHVAFAGPQLMYSWAPIEAAADAGAWAPARQIGEGRIVPTVMGFAEAPDGALHLVFMDGVETEVFHISSPDGGTSWTDPVRVTTSEPGTGASNPRLAIDREGILHVVWTPVLLPQGFPPQDVLYASSADGGQSWSDATSLAEEFYGEATIAAQADGGLFIAYNAAAGISGKFSFWSGDGGITWSRRIEVVPHTGGLDGHPNLAVDSADGVYFISGGAGLWFSAWQGGSWSEPANLVGTVPRVEAAAAEFDYIEQPAITAVAGNQLHVVFWDGRKRLWHTWRETTASGAAAATYEAPTAPPAPGTGTPTSALLATARPGLPDGLNPRVAPVGATGASSTALVFGLLPSLLIVGGVVFIRLRRRRGR